MVEAVLETEEHKKVQRRAEKPLVLHSRKVFGSRREVLIAHGEDVYRLRRTAADRLILTK